MSLDDRRIHPIRTGERLEFLCSRWTRRLNDREHSHSTWSTTLRCGTILPISRHHVVMTASPQFGERPHFPELTGNSDAIPGVVTLAVVAAIGVLV